jgi:type II secretory ATPase GspE/PulE/Tfp pilus assembly ATPase PilB-like protein
LPTATGDRIVLKLTKATAAINDLNAIGFEPETKSIFIKYLERPNGMIVVTGPNDSGKTTTLYSAIRFLNHPHCNIMTIEDRVESIIDGVNQIQTDPERSITAATILHSLKTQDPDVLMIEELSSAEGASAAISASLSDKLVLTAMPTSTINETMTQFYYFGIDPAIASQGISLIINQRLVRTLCPKCKEAYEIPSYNLRAVGVEEDLPEKIQLWKPKGCPFCHHSGYTGRTAVHELYEFDNDLRRVIADNTRKLDYARAFSKHRILSLHESVWRKIRYGVTDMEELFKITRT